MRKPGGFTLVELVVTLILVGILAVVIIPRFGTMDAYRARGFFDEALAMTRFAQKTAVAQRTPVFVNSHAASRTICLTFAPDPHCADANGVIDPAIGTQFRRTAATGITISDATFSFSGLGAPIPSSAVSINIIGDGQTRTITVERETGYVH